MNKAKTQIPFQSLLFVLAVVAWTFAISSRNEWLHTNLEIPGEEATIGGGDDAASRERWEWERLRDPSSGAIPDDIHREEMKFAKSLPTREGVLQRLAKTGGEAQVTATTWISRGPTNVGGRTRALAIDIANSSVILAGGVSGGMWRSQNSGGAWTKVTPLNSLQSVSCIVQDTRVGKRLTWYYGTGELIGNSAARFGILRGDGIYKSTDNGLTWSQLSATATGSLLFDSRFKYVWNLAIDPSNLAQDELYAAHFGGISRSTDGGATWTTTLGPNTNDGATLNVASRNTDVAVASNGVVYAALGLNTNSVDNLGNPIPSANAGLWRSPDGVTWTPITPTGFPTSYTRIVIGIAPSNPNVVYFLGETPGFGLRVIYAGSDNYSSLWKYTDNGSGSGSWVNLSSNLPDFGGEVGGFAHQGAYDLVVKVKPDNENFVLIGGTNLYRSTDGFASTTNTAWIGGYSTSNDVSEYPGQHPDQHAVAFHPTSFSEVYSGHDGGVSVTSDIATGSVAWSSLNSGYLTGQFYSLAVDHLSANTALIGGMQDNGSWFVANGSDIGVRELGGDGAFSAVADNRTSYYVSTQNGRMYRLLLDAAGNLTNFTRVDPAGLEASSYQFINPFILDPSDTRIMYLSQLGNIRRNSNLTGIALGSNAQTSTNWEVVLSPTLTNAAYTALGASRTSPTRLYLGTNTSKVYRVDNAATGSPARVDVSVGKGFSSNAFVSSIAVDPQNADKALATFSNYSVKSLFYTTDAGATWIDVGGNLEQNADGSGSGPSVRWAAILPFAGINYYFVGTSIGLFSTTNLNGASTVWAQEGANVIGNVVVDMVIARAFDGKVFVGTHGNGLFSGTLAFSATIYPGDANNDKVVDARDILPIGQFFGASGAPRPGASPTWTPQALSSPWVQNNAWYADCNGDGTIDATDATLIITNWRATYASAPPADVNRREICEELLRTIDGQASSDAMRLIREAVSSYMRNELGVLYSFALEQNFPNPFNPSTTITFSLGEPAATAELRVFDIQGREVWKKSYSNLTAGLHHELWHGRSSDGAPVASGIYIYQFIASGKSLTRRMMLLK